MLGFLWLVNSCIWTVDWMLICPLCITVLGSAHYIDAWSRFKKNDLIDFGIRPQDCISARVLHILGFFRVNIWITWLTSYCCGAVVLSSVASLASLAKLCGRLLCVMAKLVSSTCIGPELPAFMLMTKYIGWQDWCSVSHFHLLLWPNTKLWGFSTVQMFDATTWYPSGLLIHFLLITWFWLVEGFEQSCSPLFWTSFFDLIPVRVERMALWSCLQLVQCFIFHKCNFCRNGSDILCGVRCLYILFARQDNLSKLDADGYSRHKIKLTGDVPIALCVSVLYTYLSV